MEHKLEIVAPITHLPPELLARVFYCHALTEPPFQCIGCRLGWIVDTHVCRQWRQVALNATGLWGQIDVFHTNLKWITEMLARTKGAPVDFEVESRAALKKFSLISQHFHHTRQLYLSATQWSQDQRRIGDLLVLEAPTLEYLDLRLEGTKPATLNPPGDLKLFRGQAPQLKGLSIHNVRFPWRSLPHLSLSRLEITLPLDGLVIHDVAPYGRLDELISIVAGCSALEILVLEYCLGPASAKPDDQEQLIALPNLRVLSLAGSSSSVAHVLESLKLPPSTRIGLHCIVQDAVAIEPWSRVIAFVAAHCSSATFKSLSIEVAAPGRPQITVEASSSLPTSTFFPSDLFSEAFVGGHTGLSLRFDARFDSRNIQSITHEACAALPIADLEFVSLSALYGGANQYPQWAQLLQQCAKIAIVDITGEGASAFLRAINPPKSAIPQKGGGKAPQGGAGIQPVPYPAIRSLLLQTLDFHLPVPRTKILVGDLARSLILRRKKCKVPLQVLGISDCTIGAEDVGAFRDLAPEFYWDEIECESDYERYMSDSDDDSENDWDDSYYSW
ncbi:hypothetical protein BC834DRAFT_320678 [Gloeopeniophorella convolvens]|nr:hypothetical protein BC834DRAFT_320678 [Gloeopeniophorella convolvens]